MTITDNETTTDDAEEVASTVAADAAGWCPMS